jgi:hypothetical protein
MVPTLARRRGSPTSAPQIQLLRSSARTGQLADLELRRRRSGRCEDRIRCAKDTGLRNLRLHGSDQNEIWFHFVSLACDLLAWAQISRSPAQPGEPSGSGCGPSAGQDGLSSVVAPPCVWQADDAGMQTSALPSAGFTPRHQADQPRNEEGEHSRARGAPPAGCDSVAPAMTRR